MADNSIVSLLLGQLGQQANVNNVNANTQLQNTENEVKQATLAYTRQQQAAQQQAQAQIKQDEEAAQRAVQATGTVPKSDPAVGSDGWADPTSNSPMANLARSVARSQQEADRLMKRASRYEASGDGRDADDSRKQAEAIQTRVDRNQAELLKMSAETAKQLGGMANTVDSQESMDNFSSTARLLNPEVWNRLKKGVDIDPSTGQPIFNDRAKKTLKNYAAGTETRHEQMTDLAADTREKLSKERIDLERKNTEIRKIEADANRAERQAGRKDREEAAKGREQLRDFEEMRKVEDVGSKELNANPVIKNFDRYKQSYETVLNSLDVMKRTGDVSPEVSRNVQAQFANMVQDFKSMRSSTGKWAEQDEKMLQGVFQKWNGFWDNLGKGHVLDTTTLNGLINESSRMFGERNLAATKETLAVRGKVGERGADPSRILSPASIDDALDFARKKYNPEGKNDIGGYRVGKDGKQYIILGPGKEDGFPVPTQAEPPWWNKKERANAS